MLGKVKEEREAGKLTERRRNEESRIAADAERKLEGKAESTEKDGRLVIGGSFTNQLKLVNASGTLCAIHYFATIPSEDGKSLSIVLSKQNQKEWWAYVIRDGPKLGIKKLKIMPSILCDLDLDTEGRQALQNAVVSHGVHNAIGFLTSCKLGSVV
ncbi:hypothetical protein BAE44_0003774 [Dichanthelium oligosanthes]|uniref:Uncharacterized protein n=1 Tax=Dichanthelium oligosanthes TaxID=888268 RepID=A0A1E5WDA5_9POAL|nr:hypothetical protein BAE44_0003774 [Dichanthelium oligosanthes]